MSPMDAVTRVKDDACVSNRERVGGRAAGSPDRRLVAGDANEGKLRGDSKARLRRRIRSGRKRRRHLEVPRAERTHIAPTLSCRTGGDPRRPAARSTPSGLQTSPAEPSEVAHRSVIEVRHPDLAMSVHLQIFDPVTQKETGAFRTTRVEIAAFSSATPFESRKLQCRRAELGRRATFARAAATSLVSTLRISSQHLPSNRRMISRYGIRDNPRSRSTPRGAPPTLRMHTRG